MREWSLAVSCVVLGSGLANAQSVKIEHQAVACAVADKFPKLDARFSPADSVAAARVVFQGENRAEWYSVAMKSEGLSFTGVLPRPKTSLKTFRYYIEVTDRLLATNRTPEYSVGVVDGSGSCKGGLAAGALSSASVILQGPGGVAALPAGFASNGVVAAGSSTGAAVAGGAAAAGAVGVAAAGGGGLSGLAVAGIVVGAGAVAAGVAVASKGSNDSSSSPGTAPTPSTPASTSYSGPFSAQMVIQFTFAGGPGGCNTTTSSHTGTITMMLQQSGGAVTGNASVSGTRVVVANTGACSGQGNVVGDTIGISWNQPVTGTAASLGFAAQNGAEGISFTGALNSGVITGTLTLTHVLNIPSGSQSGSATTAVTLR